MRVVVLTQWFPPEKAAIPADIAEELAHRGHDVTVLTGFPNYPLGRTFDGWRQRPKADYRAKDGYGIRRVAQYPSHDRSAVRRAAGYLSFAITSTLFGWSQLRSADVVYVYSPPPTAALGPWLSFRRGGPPYVLHVQDLWPDSVLSSGMIAASEEGPALRSLRAACLRIYRDAASLIAIAPGMRDRLIHYGADASRTAVVPNWTDEKLFYPLAADASDMPDTGSERFTVMFAGNVGDAQALDVAVRAAANLADLPGFRLVIVGDGVALPSLRQLASDLHTDNVEFVAAQTLDKMNAITQSADIQLVSLRDLDFFRGTIPSKLGAVLATGTPVICAVAGDAARIVSLAGAGWTCRPEDADDLANAFRAAYSASRTELGDRGRRGRAYYLAHLSRNAGTSAICDHIECAK